MAISNRERAADAADSNVQVRMPNVRAVRDRIVANHPQASWLFVDPDGKAFVLLDGTDVQRSRAHSHVGWLVSIYGGREAGIPSLADIEGDVLHHLKAAHRVAA